MKHKPACDLKRTISECTIDGVKAKVAMFTEHRSDIAGCLSLIYPNQEPPITVDEVLKQKCIYKAMPNGVEPYVVFGQYVVSIDGKVMIYEESPYHNMEEKVKETLTDKQVEETKDMLNLANVPSLVQEHIKTYRHTKSGELCYGIQFNGDNALAIICMLCGTAHAAGPTPLEKAVADNAVDKDGVLYMSIGGSTISAVKDSVVLMQRYKPPTSVANMELYTENPKMDFSEALYLMQRGLEVEIYDRHGKYGIMPDESGDTNYCYKCISMSTAIKRKCIPWTPSHEEMLHSKWILSN